MSAAELRHLASIGLTADQIAGIAEMLDAREAARPTSTDRVRAFRQRRMERDETPMKRDETFHVTLTPSPSPPPLSPLHPPLPAPTPTPPHMGTAHTREAGTELFPADPKPKKAKSRAATAEEVETFARSIGCLPGQGEAAFWKWEGNGWTNGKAPIKDWQATVRAWKAQGYAPFTPFNATPANAPREAPKSFAQQDAERKAAERHGPEVITPRILFSAPATS